MRGAMVSQTSAYVRLGLAVALSALLHALLLGGVSARRQASEEPLVAVLTARLERLDPSQGEGRPQAFTAAQGPAMADAPPAERPVGVMRHNDRVDALRPAGSPHTLAAASSGLDPWGTLRLPAEAPALAAVTPQSALRQSTEERPHGVSSPTYHESLLGHAGPANPGSHSPASAPMRPSAPFDPRPPMDVPVIVDTTYYETRDLDDLPVTLAPIEPRFPDDAARAGVAGHVTLEVHIDEFGVVREAHVIDTAPAGRFESSALESFRAARFTPAQRNGQAVRCKVVIRVDFTPAAQPLASTR